MFYLYCLPPGYCVAAIVAARCCLRTLRTHLLTRRHALSSCGCRSTGRAIDETTGRYFSRIWQRRLTNITVTSHERHGVSCHRHCDCSFKWHGIRFHVATSSWPAWTVCLTTCCEYNNIENIEAVHNLPCVRGVQHWPMVSPHPSDAKSHNRHNRHTP